MTDPFAMWCRVQEALARLAAGEPGGELPLEGDRLWQRLQSDTSFREGLEVGRMLRRELAGLDPACESPAGESGWSPNRRGCWASDLLLAMLTAPRDTQRDAAD